MITPAKSLSLTAFFTLLLIAFMMGSNHVAARLAFNDGLDVATAVTVRSFATALVVACMVAWSGLTWRVNAKQGRGLLIVGLLIGTQSQLLYGAVSRLPVALALIAFNTFPIWTALWDRVIYRKTPDKAVLRALPILFVGLFLALDVLGAASGLSASAHAMQVGVGVGLALAAAAVFGVSLVVMQHETAGVDGRVRTAITLGLAGAVALSVVGVHGGPHWPHSSVGWLALGMVVFLYGTAFTIMFTLLPKLGVGNNAAIMNAEPVFALIVAWLVLGQTIAPSQIAGALLVVGTVIWLGFRKR
ncbi:MAG: DMT family transporter [Cytophagales bacterium]|nr:DMT family transporter [Cytophagales bacterium]